MKKKKLFVVDNDVDFQKQVTPLCPQDKVEIQFYSSSMEIFSLIGKENPLLVFVNLETPDLNDFVMYDLLKKTNDKSIPVLITYSDQSESEIKQYKKLKFQAQGYYKKPLGNDSLFPLLEKYLELSEEEDDDGFSDDSIDKLVRGEIAEVAIIPRPDRSKDDTAERIDSNASSKAEENEIPLIIEKETISWDEEPQEEKVGRPETELRNQVISLERQNEFLRSENKELSRTIETLKREIESKHSGVVQLKSELDEKIADKEATVEILEKRVAKFQDEFDKIQSEIKERESGFAQKIDTLKNYSEKLENQNNSITQQLKKTEKDKSILQLQIKELTDQLTDKERELVARNHEFEKSLQKKSDEMVQAAEEHLMAEFERKESQFRKYAEQLTQEKDKIQSTLNTEMEKLKQAIRQLQEDNSDLGKREEALNRTVSTLAGEKVTLSEKITALEQQLAQQQKEIKEKENQHLTTLKNFSQEMEEARYRLNFYKNRVKELGELLQQAVSLTQLENHESTGKGSF